METRYVEEGHPGLTASQLERVTDVGTSSDFPALSAWFLPRRNLEGTDLTPVWTALLRLTTGGEYVANIYMPQRSKEPCDSSHPYLDDTD